MKFTFADSLISEEKIQETIQGLSSYLAHLQEVSQDRKYQFNESSINLPLDQELLEQIVKIKEQKVGEKLKYIIDIGIGGSNLGTKAVYDALVGYKDLYEPQRLPKILFADTNDPEILKSLTKLLTEVSSEDEVLINAISKSGGTTETISNLEIILASLKRFPDIKNRLVITTDKDSKLWNRATELSISVLPIPKLVGGRYSVFSSVGLFPLLSSGVDIESLREGASQMRELCLQEGLNNPALISAVILYLQSQEGKLINDNFFFHSELESVGKWYRQLMAESIGKEVDLEGNKVNTGITPNVSIGSTDLHSMVQLYLGGPRDKLTTFISTDQSAQVMIPETLNFPLVEGIAGKEAKVVMNAILEGTKEAYRRKGLPFMEVVLEAVNTRSIGEFLQFKMIEMMFLGKLLNINSFDQPNVEDYKRHAREILNRS